MPSIYPISAVSAETRETMNVRCTSISEHDGPASEASHTEAAPATLRSGLLLRVLEGEHAAQRQLVEALTPTIRASVARELSFRRRRAGRANEHDVEDITQSVLLRLFTDGGRTLKAWNPARGRKLESFVALLAQRRTVSVLRSRRQSHSVEDPMPAEDLDQNAVEANGPESRTISRDMLAALVEAVRARSSARGAQVFKLLYLEGMETEDVCAATGLNAAAVYQWKHRLRQLLDEVAAELGARRQPEAH
jgi:RNA polymerase sigma-70 factor (ECF subfamily)